MSRQEIEDLVVRAFVAVDERDWPALEATLTDPLTLDMTSLAGGEPATMSPTDVSSIWAEGFANIDHVHHQVSNFRTHVDGDRAQVQCYGIAFHHREGIEDPVNWRQFVGTYVFDLVRTDRWRIDRLEFRLKFVSGNRQLENAR